MSIKDNYIRLIKKFGGHQYIIKKGINKNTIDSLMKGSDIGVSKAYNVAKVLGVTMEELYLGMEKAQEIREEAAIYLDRYRPHNQEEEKYIDKILLILRSDDQEAKITIKKMLDSIRRDAWAAEDETQYKKKSNNSKSSA